MRDPQRLKTQQASAACYRDSFIFSFNDDVILITLAILMFLGSIARPVPRADILIAICEPIF
jgi:hypothetical protein